MQGTRKVGDPEGGGPAGGRGGSAQGRWTPGTRAVHPAERGARTGGGGMRGRRFLPGPFSFLREIGSGSGPSCQAFWNHLISQHARARRITRPAGPCTCLSGCLVMAAGSHLGTVGVQVEISAASIT